MIYGLHTTRIRASVPAMGLWVPAATLHLVVFAVSAGLCLLVLEAPSGLLSVCCSL